MKVDIYKAAAQLKLRFPSGRGDLTTEDLFSLPLQAKGGFDLDTIARTINGDIKAYGEESFVENRSESPAKRELELKLELLKDVIKTKQEANAAKATATARAEERQKILDILDSKGTQKLLAASEEDLRKRLVELGS